MNIKLSVVFFTYNRSGYLAHAITQFIKNCQMKRNEYEIIISDDGSNKLHRKKIIQIKEDFAIEKVLLNEHKGMGKNFNSGLKAAQGKYVLHLEDDWELQTDCGNIFNRSIAFLEQHPEVDMVRMSALENIDLLTGLEPYGEGFQKLNRAGNMYSNEPHIKRRDFHKYFQWFKEDCSLGDCRENFSRSILSMNPLICWSGNVFQHFGFLSTLGEHRTEIHDIHEILYNSTSNRQDLLDLANTAMKSNDLFVARHALEKFEASGECDAQVQQSLEIVREICNQTLCAS